MVKNKLKIIALILAVILLLGTSYVFAENETDADYSVLPISEDVSEDVDATNDDVEAALYDEPNAEDEDTENNTDITSHDVYLFGDDVTIDYIVDGNVFVIADNVTINSQIGGDVFVLAKNLVIGNQGYIYSNLFTMSSTVDVKGYVYDIYSFSKDLTISGYVFRDVKSSCESLNIFGTVERNVFASCSNISFSTQNDTEIMNGTINGKLEYSSASEIEIPENAVKSGIVTFTQDSKDESKVISDYLSSLGAFLCLVIAIWLLCLWLAPKFLENTNNLISKKILPVIGFGLLALIVIPIVVFLLCFVGITVSTALLLLSLYILLIAISSSIFVITINNFICNKLKIKNIAGNFGMLVATGIVLWLLTLIPYAGSIISFAMVTVGLGIISIHLIFRNKENKSENVEIVK